LNPDVLNPGEEEGLDQAEGESEFEEIEIVADDDDLDESPGEPKLGEIEIACDGLDESSDEHKLGENEIAGDAIDAKAAPAGFKGGKRKKRSTK
ncbi:MAG: hypothetical protein LBT59_21710, partial [Clostridiales bacterium]|nr:hypothetical protein [Clostridiales bacterium]